MKEQDKKSGREKWGKRILYGGLIAGAIGLIVESAGLILAGGGLAAGGIIFENTGKQNKGN